MSATGLTTDAIKNAQANNFASVCLYVTLLKALDLQAAVITGATTFQVDLSVAAGDILVFEQGTSNQEQVTVGSVTGSGPYTVTPATSLTKSHAQHAKIGHVPLTSATVHEITTRTAASWGSPSPAGIITSGASAITVPSGNVVGSLALFSASTAGTYYDATAVAAQDFTAASGTYTPLWVETCS